MSLLQADPSRTSIIRQSFERDFERRINKLAQAVRTLLKSQAFGQKLTANAFCPTGKGGGVDPTCSPKRTQVKMNRTNWILVHGGSEWETFDKSHLGTGEPGGIRPLGPGFYVYVATNKSELIKAIEAAKVYAIKYGGKSPAIHLLSMKPPKGSVELRGGQQLHPTLMSVEQKHYLDLLTKAHSLPVGAERSKAFDQAWILEKKIKPHIKIKATTLPDSDEPSGGLIEAAIHDSTLMTKIGHWSIKSTTEDIISGLTSNTRWTFEESQSKVDSFEQWLKAKLSEVLSEKDIHSGTDWWRAYIERAYKFGAARAFDQVYKKSAKPSEGFLGAKQFFMGSMTSEVIKQRLKVLIGRTYKDIEGLTNAMRVQLTQDLTDGLLQGISYEELGKRISKRLDISKTRAKMIARTEIVRAQAEGQLAALKALGIDKLGVQVEFHTAKKPCPKCRKYQGRILTVKQAEGLIPLHPNCKCAFTPFITPVPSPQKTARRKALEALILRSKVVGKKK